MFVMILLAMLMMFVITHVIPNIAMKWSLFESHGAEQTAFEGSANAQHDVYDFMETYGLSQDDRMRYIRIFALQDEGLWREADEFIFHLSSQELMPYVLAQRYSDTRYHPTAKQLREWLLQYQDVPQYDAVLERFEVLYPTDAHIFKRDHVSALEQHQNTTTNAQAAAPAAAVTAPTRGSSFPFDPKVRSSDMGAWRQAMQALSNGKYTLANQTAKKIIARSGTRSPSAYFLAGLSAWQLEQMEEAAKAFSMMADCGCLLPDEERAAAAFWAFRANERLSNTTNAVHYLRIAAALPNSFYGQIAESTLNSSDVLKVMDVAALSAHEWKAASDSRQLKRILALTAVGKKDEAQRHFNALYNKHPQIQGVLRQLGSALEFSMLPATLAQDTSKNYNARRFSNYQIPGWTRSLERSSDKALVLAIVRQESGFNARAQSPRGAQGLMQIMPQTAAFMRGMDFDSVEVASTGDDAYGLYSPLSQRLHSSQTNLQLGQKYLRHLRSMPEIRNNIILTAAAYNAGPNAIKGWMRTQALEDPLMFVETIPYGETRGYVKNILRNYWVYQSLLKQPSSGASAIGQGQWPQLSMK